MSVKNYLLEDDELNEMAQITGGLKDAINKVIDDNPELNGLALKKAIKADDSVKQELNGSELYDNQLNSFIQVAKGEKELQARGRKPSEGTSNKNKLAVILSKLESGEKFTPEETDLIVKLYKATKFKKSNEEIPEVTLHESRWLKYAGLI